MNYDFSLDKKGIFSVLGSSVLMGALLFAAGLIVGSYWTAKGPTASAAARQKAADANALPQEPVLMSDIPQANLVVPGKPSAPNLQTTLPATAVPPQTAPAAAAPPAAADQPAANAPDQASDNKSSNPAADGAAPPTQKAEDPAPRNPDSQLVTVEVGTFLDANAANRLFKSLERKGYAPTFFTGLDAQSREWYAIRIGAYSDKQQAENAAANFAKQEKMKAVVRPL